MLNFNNNNNSQFSFLDILNIMSFYVGMLNLEQNLTQNDKQELETQLNDKINMLLNEIHTHLEKQDSKIDSILAYLEEQHNDNGRNIF